MTSLVFITDHTFILSSLRLKKRMKNRTGNTYKCDNPAFGDCPIDAQYPPISLAQMIRPKQKQLFVGVMSLSAKRNVDG